MIWVRAALLLASVAFGWLVGPTLAHDVARCDNLSNGDDTFDGSGGRNLRCGLNGNDNMFGNGGNDGLDGDDGEDTLEGGPGDDHLFGDGGDDILRGGAGDDDVEGGTSDDQLFGNDDNDMLKGGEGVDRQQGGPGDDTFLVERGDVPDRRKETLKGGEGPDTARFFFGGGGVGCPKSVKDPTTSGKYILKSIANCNFGE